MGRGQEQYEHLIALLAHRIRTLGIDCSDQVGNHSGFIRETLNEPETPSWDTTQLNAYMNTFMNPPTVVKRKKPNGYEPFVRRESRRFAAAAYIFVHDETARLVAKARDEAPDTRTLEGREAALKNAIRTAGMQCLTELIESQEWAVNLANRAVLATEPRPVEKPRPHERRMYHPVVRDMSRSFYRVYNNIPHDQKLTPLEKRRVENFTIAATSLAEGFAMRVRISNREIDSAKLTGTITIGHEHTQEAEAWTPFTLALYALARQFFNSPNGTTTH